ncbi:unnamed protein product [Thelazia callipaeda]|uniref:Ovule protein n=1 Tax=Thelazia callipaeda TaxID=103827 RepID=A0A0N5D0A9_THECL|nr:unnamed protein product [Thelazia callipaeda]
MVDMLNDKDIANCFVPLSASDSLREYSTVVIICCLIFIRQLKKGVGSNEATKYGDDKVSVCFAVEERKLPLIRRGRA